MKDEGLSADRVAYNAMFSALRVAGDADKVRRLLLFLDNAASIFKR
jgi:hypothetical protein